MSGGTDGSAEEEISSTRGGRGCSLAKSTSIIKGDTTQGLEGRWGPQVLEIIICIGDVVEVEGVLGVGS